MDEELIAAMENLDEEKVLNCVKELSLAGTSNLSIIRLLNAGMVKVGKLFESRSYYIADLIVSGTIYRQALELLEIEENGPSQNSLGKILIGVVKNDIHDIGKDIIVWSLRSEGFEVIDMGTDVSDDDFISAIISHKPDILALSGTMSYTADEMSNIINKIKETGMRNNIIIIIGGNGITKENADCIGADYYAADPIEAINLCNKYRQ
jgi:methanogenic corrinoid protein MtbC1